VCARATQNIRVRRELPEINIKNKTTEDDRSRERGEEKIENTHAHTEYESTREYESAKERERERETKRKHDSCLTACSHAHSTYLGGEVLLYRRAIDHSLTARGRR
jgi:hypothetical protein